MKRRTLIHAAILAGGITTAAIGAAYARPFHGCGDGPHGWHASPYGHGGGWRGFMHHLKLTQEQHDAIFKIFYSEEPAIREKRIVLRHDRKALVAAAMTDHYDPRGVQQLAAAQAQTQSQLIVLRNRAFNRTYRVLTPRQQAEVARWQRRYGGD